MIRFISALALALALAGGCKRAPSPPPGGPALAAEPGAPESDPAAGDPAAEPAAAPESAPDPSGSGSDAPDPQDGASPPEGPSDAGTATSGDDVGASKSSPTKASPPGREEPPPLPPPIFSAVDASCGKDPGVGSPAKPFTLQSPAGKPVVLARYKRRVVLLNFWGTWCKPCLKELPEFDRLYRRYRKHGLTLIAVATDEDAEAVAAFVKQRKLAAKVAIGGQDLADAYGSPQFPFSYVIDRDQIIRAAYRGYKPKCLGKLEQDIRAQLEALRRR